MIYKWKVHFASWETWNYHSAKFENGFENVNRKLQILTIHVPESTMTRTNCSSTVTLPSKSQMSWTNNLMDDSTLAWWKWNQVLSLGWGQDSSIIPKGCDVIPQQFPVVQLNSMPKQKIKVSVTNRLIREVTTSLLYENLNYTSAPTTQKGN